MIRRSARRRNEPSPDFVDLSSFVVNTEEDGRLSRTGIFQSSEAQLKQIVRSILAYFRSTPGPNRLLFYCHGALVTENEAGELTRTHHKMFLANGIYPVFFIWQSSLQEIIGEHLTLMKNNRLELISDGEPLIDEILEEVARLFPEPWEMMKRRAEKVFADGGGWRFFTLLTQALRKMNVQAELHLVGHSAGSIVLASFLKQLLEKKINLYLHLKIGTCSLYAPACTVKLFEESYARAIERHLLRRFFLYTLSDELEREDPTVPYYRKSILYLVSSGFEAQSGDCPILGMQKHAKTSTVLQNLLSAGKAVWILAEKNPQTQRFPYGGKHIELVSHAVNHSSFTRDPATLNSTLRIILRSNQVPAEFS
ncbi:alpha/beta hydrolase [Effusibacillus dendaii]|uniref:Alpha/beta hydrolase n=1 Tax=Effusibacillus dendaii TaxID=2743772 RepID=A0A7I8DA50_9BACL|nr:alpha/beta hydrolase [Effusibacillus dendaii]BCJ86857.1 hypothetical protein skT53_18420 [Effusibacillus dendaii]